MGLLALAAGVGLSAACVGLGWGPLTRWALAPVFLSGFLGILQARDHTCVALAASGHCHLDGGLETIDDPAVLRVVRARAARVALKSVVATAVVMLALLLLP